MQEKNLKVNVTLRSVIEKKYPDFIKKKEGIYKLQEEEKNISDSKEENKDPDAPKAFNPLLILNLSRPLKRTIFPQTAATMPIRFKYDPEIIHQVCPDKQFLALTPEQI
mmetsp:Transcript_32712/g.29593  ORF Transcript_32712/g.29593 Transcript_32712/m.29593 type:complete len:109 (+) Transcript_32712:221-547(+)